LLHPHTTQKYFFLILMCKILILNETGLNQNNQQQQIDVDCWYEGSQLNLEFLKLKTTDEKVDQ